MNEQDILKMAEDGTADQIMVQFDGGELIEARSMKELKEKIRGKQGKITLFGIGVPGGSVGRKDG